MNTKWVDAEEWLEKRVGKLTLGKMIKCIRECDELSQPDLARKLGISKSHLCDIEQDRKNVSPERASRFAEILGYSQPLFIQLSLQGIIDKSRLKLKVFVEAA